MPLEYKRTISPEHRAAAITSIQIAMDAEVSLVNAAGFLLYSLCSIVALCH